MKPRAKIISDAEFRQAWTQSRTIEEVLTRTGYNHDAAVRRGRRLDLPPFRAVPNAVRYQLQEDRWLRTAELAPATDAQHKLAAYAAGLLDAAGKFDTVRAATGGILGHRLTVTLPRQAEKALTELCTLYKGEVAAPLIGAGVRSSTSLAWTIDTVDLYAFALVVQHHTKRWADELYAVILFYQSRS